MVEVCQDSSFIVPGFRAAAVRAGLKKNAHALDLALIFSETPATAAGVFTTNQVQAAPVLVTKDHIAAGKARAIIANAGNANACTGQRGLADARRTSELVAEALNIPPREVLVASTGVIGQPLNMDLIARAVPALVSALANEHILLAAQAIMTTDSFPKIKEFEGRAGGVPYRIQGMAKGAGMIMPHMATMLCFIMSDIKIHARDLQEALSAAVAKTFNRITVDGDTSTNDMVLVLANGLAENGLLSDQDLEGFSQGLEAVMADLGRMIVQDGEGATKLVDIVIKGAKTPADAVNGACRVANSSLVKTAFFGQDPNWGRIMAALGRAGILMAEDHTDIWVDAVQIVAAGLGKGAEAERAAARIMRGKAFTITVNLNQGVYEDRMVTCDLTHEYVSINADYRT